MPHLGSSLGPAAGGRSRDGHLVCPFHGFTYDVTGICVATPYAEPPASVRLKVFDTREILGLVFAWWGIDGRPPQWDLPDEPSARGEWSGMELRTLRFPGHPQETTENSVDLAHLQGSVASLAKGRCVIRGLPVHLMILRWPDGPVAMPWPRSGRTVRDRRRARRSGPRRQCRPGGRTSRPGPCAARASPRSP